MNEAAAPARKSKRQLQEVAIFNDVAKALTSSLNLDSILQTIMDKMAEFFRPDTWSLLMVDEQRDELYFAIAVGDAAETLKTVRMKLGEGIAGWVARHGESLIVPDVYNDPRFARRVDEMTKWKTRSIICVPLQSKHRVLGVIQLINCAMESFGEEEMFFLHALCDYAAIAIDNARAVEKIQELTITDDCTGLYNARHLYKTLESEVYRSARFETHPGHDAQHRLPGRRRAEPQCPLQHGPGQLPRGRQEFARDHPPGRRDDVRGQELQPRQHRRGPAGDLEVRSCSF